MDSLLRCLATAKQAGSPRDQAERFVGSSYVPLPWQWKFHAAARLADVKDGPVEIGAGGARGPGKSHAVFAQIGLDDCQRFAGLKGLFLRQTVVSAKESFGDLIDKVLQGKTNFERTQSSILFANGSRIILGGFKDENDIDKYVGIEYDFIAIEELNQLSEDKLEKLKGSLRTSKQGWRPRLYTSFNPGGSGHGFVKSRFVIPWRTRSETKTRFVPATYRENPYLNDEYIEYLEGLTGDLGRAWREGEWDLFAGQYFKEWRYDVHVCEPFEIPREWRRFVSGDYGFRAPSSIGWYASSPDGKVYRYRELYGSGMSYSQLADEYVARTSPTEEIEYIVFDPAFWAKKGERDDALSGAEVFSKRVKEITKRTPRMVRGDNNRIPGWGVVREYLKSYLEEEELTADLQVFSTCTELIRTLPELQHDTLHPEDLDSDGEDHAADELRYALMSRPPKTPKQLSAVAMLLTNDERRPTQTSFE